MDAQYRINFYRTILNNHGRQFRSRLASTEIRSARSMERAVEAAKRRFARDQRISVWDLLAHDFDVEELAPPFGRSEAMPESGQSLRPSAAQGKSAE